MAELVCPSGLTFSARPWVFGDIKKLIDNSEAMLFMRMFEMACTQIIDPGPYQLAKDGGLACPDDLSMADLTSAVILIRKLTDREYSFDAACDHCPHVNHLTQDLNDIDIEPSSAEGIEHLRTNAPIERIMTVNDMSVKVYFRILRAKDSNIIARFQKQDRASSLDIQTVLSISEIKIQGQEQSLKTPVDIRNFIDNNPWKFKQELDFIVDDLEGGADPFVEFTCQKCFREATVVLPLDEKFFGLDSQATYKRRQKRRLARR